MTPGIHINITHWLESTLNVGLNVWLCVTRSVVYSEKGLTIGILIVKCSYSVKTRQWKNTV